jgi:hypothetical protein
MIHICGTDTISLAPVSQSAHRSSQKWCSRTGMSSILHYKPSPMRAEKGLILCSSAMWALSANLVATQNRFKRPTFSFPLSLRVRR